MLQASGSAALSARRGSSALAFPATDGRAVVDVAHVGRGVVDVASVDRAVVDVASVDRAVVDVASVDRAVVDVAHVVDVVHVGDSSDAEAQRVASPPVGLRLSRWNLVF